MNFDLQQYRRDHVERRHRLFGAPAFRRARQLAEQRQDCELRRQTQHARRVERLRALFEQSRPNLFRHPGKVIRDRIAAAYGFSPADLEGQSRLGPVVYARATAIAAVRHQTKLSMVSVGQLFGGRDHTTVLNAIQNVDADLDAMAARVAARFAELGGDPARMAPACCLRGQE